ncbi:unnamed protein product [Lampetra fluviatilis]
MRVPHLWGCLTVPFLLLQSSSARPCDHKHRPWVHVLCDDAVEHELASLGRVEHADLNQHTRVDDHNHANNDHTNNDHTNNDHTDINHTNNDHNHRCATHSATNNFFHGDDSHHLGPNWEGPLVVVARCEFTNTSSVDESVVDAAFKAGTNQLYNLGPYLLKNTDLTVTTPTVPELSQLIPTTSPPFAPTVGDQQHFYIKFTIVNRNYSSDLAQSYSPLRTEYTTNISNLLENLFYQKIGDAVQACTVTNYWEGPLVVVARCEFTNTSSVDESVVDAAFKAGTNQLNDLGPYLLKNTDLTVTTPVGLTQGPQQHFYIKFTIINRNYSSDLAQSYSPLRTEYTTNISNLGPQQHFYIKFTIINRNYSSDLAQSYSPLRTEYTTNISNLGPQQHFYIKFTIINRNYSSDLAQSYSPLRTEYTTNISNLLEDLFRKQVGNAQHNCTVTNYWPGTLVVVVVVAKCEFTNTSSVDESVVDAAFKNGTEQLTSLGLYQLNTTDLSVTRPIVSVATTMKTTAAVGPTLEPLQHFYIKFTIVNRNYSSDLAQSNSTLRQEYTANISGLLEDLFRKQVGNAQHNCTVTNYWPGTLVVVVVAKCEFTNTSSVDKSVVDAAFKNGTEQLTSLGLYQLNTTDLSVTRPIVSVATTMKTTAAVGPTLEPLQHFYIKFTIVNRNYSSDLAQSNSTLRQEYTANISGLLEDLFRKQVGNAQHNCTVTNYWPGTLVVVVAKCEFTNTSSVDESVVDAAFKNGTEKLTSLGLYLLNTTDLIVNRTEPLPPTEAPIAAPETLVAFFIKFTVVNYNYTVDLDNSSSPLYQEHSKNISQELEKLYKNVKGINLKNCTVVDFWDQPLAVVAKCFFVNTSDVNNNSVHENFKNGTKSLKKLGNYSLTEKDADVTVTTLKDFDIQFTIHNHTFKKELKDNNSSIYKEYVKNITELVENLYRTKYNKTLHYCVITGFTEGSIKVDCKCYFTNSSTVTVADILETFSNKTDGIDVLGAYKLQPNKLTVNAKPIVPPPAETLKPYYLKFTVTNQKYKTDLETVTSQSYANITKGISAELDKLFNKEIGNKSHGCTVVDYWPANNDGALKDLVVVAKCNFTDTPEVNKTVVWDAFYKGTNGTYKLGAYDLKNNALEVKAEPFVPPTAEKLKPYYLKFTVTNHKYKTDLETVTSQSYADITKGISAESRRYDSRTTIFSPEGRLYQVEYAMEAIGHAGTCLGILATDGVLLAAERRNTHKLLDEVFFSEKIYKLNEDMACSVAGITSDANVLTNELRVIAQRYLFQYQEPIPCEQLVTTLCDIKQAYTQFGGKRPFGVSILYMGWDKHYGYQLYQSDPSGNYGGWKATCIGNNSAASVSMLKQEYKEGDMTLQSALALAIKVLNKTMDVSKLTAEKVEIATLTRENGITKIKVLKQKEVEALVKKHEEEEAKAEKEKKEKEQKEKEGKSS